MADRKTARSPLRDRADDSLLTLIGDLPELVRNLIAAELKRVKTYAGQLAKHGGWTAALGFVALFFVFWTVPAFLAFVIILLDLWIPLWVAALIVFVLGIVFAAIFALWAYFGHIRKIQRLENPVQSAKTDVRILKEFADEF